MDEPIEIRPPQRFVNRVGKYSIKPPRTGLKKLQKLPPLAELIKSLHLNPICLPGISRGYYSRVSRGYNPYHKKIVPRRNDPCSCGSGLKYKKCCALNN